MLFSFRRLMNAEDGATNAGASGTPAPPLGAPPLPPVTPPPSGEGTDPAAAASAPRFATTDMSPEALRERLKREREKAEKEAEARVLARLGISDPEKYVAEREASKAELAKFKAEEEKRKRAAMTETQRVAKDFEEEKRKRLELEAKLEAMETMQMRGQQQQKLEAIASQHIDSNPRVLRAVVNGLFADYLRELQETDPKAFAALDDRKIGRWFADIAKECPHFAKKKEPSADEVAAAATEEAKKKAPPMTTAVPSRPVVRRPINAPAPRTPPTTPTTGQTKNARPGAGMSKDEVRQLATTLGVKYPM